MEYQTTTSTPAVGKWSADSANPTMISLLYLRPNNSNSGWGYNWVDSWDANAGGTVTIDAGNSQSNPDRGSYEVISVAGNTGTGILTVSVALQTSGLGLTSGDLYDIGFSEKGYDGACGVKGDTGQKGNVGQKGVTGEKGDPGDKGDKGTKGDTGIKGDTGLKGDKGVKGDTGIKGDIGVKGETGAKGTTGAKGETGIKGNKG